MLLNGKTGDIKSRQFIIEFSNILSISTLSNIKKYNIFYTYLTKNANSKCQVIENNTQLIILSKY